MPNKKYPEIMRARVTLKCLVWFKTEAENRGMNLSEFIREIPTIISVWENQLDEKDNIILTLKEENLALKDFFDGFITDSSHDFMRVDIFEYDEFKKKWLDGIKNGG